MNNEMLLFLKIHTDMLIEQTKTKPQETIEYKLKKWMEMFIFNPPITLSEYGKWLITKTSCETTNAVFNITDENNSFSISIPFYWRIPN